ncbi:MAG: rhodanese-like domain-containing protein [Anaerolineae bacterium]|nr:rhodanese-like domain-containing protein [Anaerolineae bacterium]
MYTNISPQELNAFLANKTFPLINVHIPYEGEIEKTDAFIPFDEIEKNLDQLPKDKSAQIVLYCRSGRMSQEAANTLVKLGFTNVWNLDRGMIGWEQTGYPILEKNQQP